MPVFPRKVEGMNKVIIPLLALMLVGSLNPSLHAQVKPVVATGGVKESNKMIDTVAVTRLEISLASAQKALHAALKEAAENSWNISVAVVGISGDLIAFAKADDAIAVSPAVAIEKARTAALLKAPSKKFEEYINSGRPSFLSTPGVTGLEGGVPIIVAGNVIGAVGVSGAHGPNDSQVAETAAQVITVSD